MIVGDAMGGKSSAYKVLAAALADLNASGLLEEFKASSLLPLYTMTACRLMKGFCGLHRWTTRSSIPSPSLCTSCMEASILCLMSGRMVF